MIQQAINFISSFLSPPSFTATFSPTSFTTSHQEALTQEKLTQIAQETLFTVSQSKPQISQAIPQPLSLILPEDILPSADLKNVVALTPSTESPNLSLIQESSENEQQFYEAIRIDLTSRVMKMKIANELQIIEEHSGHLWRCIGRKPSLVGKGWIYQFQIKEEFSPFNPNYQQLTEEKLNEIFPALEESWDSIDNMVKQNHYYNFFSENKIGSIFKAIVEQWKINPDDRYYYSLIKSDSNLKNTLESVLKNEVKESVDRSNALMKTIVSILNQLGFNNQIGVRDGKENFLLECPDCEALIDGWLRVQNNYPELHLPNIKIIDSRGVASDRRFIESYRRADIFISSDREFLHDITNHAIQIISLIISSRLKDVLFKITIPKTNDILSDSLIKKMIKDFRAKSKKDMVSYEEIRERRNFLIDSFSKILRQGNQLIDKDHPSRKFFDLMEMALAGYIDIIVSLSDPRMSYLLVIKSPREALLKILLSPSWVSCFERRIGEPICSNEIKSEWEKIFDLIEANTPLSTPPSTPSSPNS